MSLMPIMGGFGEPGRDKMINVLTTLSLTASLEICLDAGDENSYTSGAKWLDVSGNGYDFDFGLNAAVEGDEPTFVGVAGGLSAGEYMEATNGDEGFDYDAAGITNETFMNDQHKDAATYSKFCMVWRVSGGRLPLMGGNRWNDPGVGHDIGTSGELRVLCRSPATIYGHTGDTAVGTDQWTATGLSVDEDGGSVSFLWTNGAYNQVSASDLWDASITTPSSDDAGGHYTVMANGGNGTSNFNDLPAAGSRMAMAVHWSSALTKANFDDILAAVGGPYGL